MSYTRIHIHLPIEMQQMLFFSFKKKHTKQTNPDKHLFSLKLWVRTSSMYASSTALLKSDMI